MRKIIVIATCFLGLIFSNCDRRNYVYSNASLDKPYEYDPYWDFKGYSPHTSDASYRRYDPDRKDAIVKNSKKDRGTEEN